MSNIPDYSEIGSFNLAALEAVQENVTEKDFDNTAIPTVSVDYMYKGRELRVKAKVVLWGYMEGSPLLESVNVLSVETIKKFDDK